MNRITLGQLEAFFWVAELGSVSAAAIRLNLSQPTISLRLRQLEAEVAAPVLERSGRGVRVTAAGQDFLARARAVLDAHAKLNDTSERRTVSGAFRIGLAEGFAIACLPHLVPALAKAYPLLRPEWTVTTSAALEDDVVGGHLDMAVLVDALGHRRLRLHPLGVQPNVWAASPQLGLRPGVGPRDLAHLTVVTTPPPTSMYRNTSAWFAERGERPSSLCMCTSVNAAAQLVEAGIGVGIFPAKMIAAYRSANGIAALDTDPALPVGRVYMADRAAAEEDRSEPVMQIVSEVTRALRYFE